MSYLLVYRIWILQITVYYKELLTINCQGTNHPRSILSFMDISILYRPSSHTRLSPSYHSRRRREWGRSPSATRSEWKTVGNEWRKRSGRSWDRRRQGARREKGRWWAALVWLTSHHHPFTRPLPFPSPLHSPRRARSVGDGDGKGNRMSTEPDPTTDGTGTGRD